MKLKYLEIHHISQNLMSSNHTALFLCPNRANSNIQIEDIVSSHVNSMREEIPHSVANYVKIMIMITIKQLRAKTKILML